MREGGRDREREREKKKGGGGGREREGGGNYSKWFQFLQDSLDQSGGV